MRLSFLKHLLNAVTALSEPERITVLGSSSLLAHVPTLGDPGQPIEVSLDADLLIEPMDEINAEILKEAIGSNSNFAKRYGYYADILRHEIVETLPAGWYSRLVGVEGYRNVQALALYDLAVVKLMVGREKDLELLRALLRLRILEPQRLRQHFQQTPLGERETFAAGRNLTLLLREFGEG